MRLINWFDEKMTLKNVILFDWVCFSLYLATSIV